MIRFLPFDRAALRGAALAMAFACGAGLLSPSVLSAQAPDAGAAPANPADPSAAPPAAPPADGQLTPPPVVDPKGVGTQSVQPVPAAPDLTVNPLDRTDGFGEQVELKPLPVLLKRGQSSWEEGFASIVAAVKEVDAELVRLKLKPIGSPLVVYTSTDDAGFDFELALPFSGATTEKPTTAFEFAASPAGKALRFTHRGSYDAMDPTYEQIANLLDAKDLEAQDTYIEEYRSDPRTTPQDDLVIDIYVPLK